MKTLLKEKKMGLAKLLSDNSRYVDDLSNIAVYLKIYCNISFRYMAASLLQDGSMVTVL